MTKEALMNTKGATAYFGCTENWIHKLVYSGKLKAYIYDNNGVLVEREPNTPRQGQGLYFYEKDLKAYKGRKKGRPTGSKDKAGRKPTKKAALDDDTAKREAVRKEQELGIELLKKWEEKQLEKSIEQLKKEIQEDKEHNHEQ